MFTDTVMFKCVKIVIMAVFYLFPVVSPNRKTKDTKIESDITGDCSGYFKKLCISAAQVSQAF
jgi:hypothetical protein